MPQELQDLSVGEVAICDRGANSEVDPATGRKVSRARIALYKRDAPDDVTKYHPEQSREKGSWTDGGAGEKSEAADKLTADAKTAGDHQAAGAAHGTAAQFHRVAAAAATKVGHTKAAEDHSKLADQHDAKALDHYQQSIAQKSDKEDPMEAWDDNDPICKAIEFVGKAGQAVDGVEFPASDWAYTPDKDHPSTWKLRLTSKPGGSPDPAIVGAAVAALGPGGFRGKKVQIPAEDLAGVKAKVRAAWRAANPEKGADDLPPILKGENMTLQELEARVTKQDADNAALQAENAVLKAENELILKMSKKEKKAFGAMSEEKRKAYMAADAEKRKAMMDEECKGMGDDEEVDKIEARIAKIEADSTQKVTVLADQVAKSTTEIAVLKAENAEIRKRERLVVFTKRAEDELPHTPGTPVEKGEMLMTLADTLPGGEAGDVFKRVFGNLKSADERMKPLFREIGKHGGGEGSALQALQAKADEIQKRDNISKSAAYGQALLENPKLYEQSEAERLAAV